MAHEEINFLARDYASIREEMLTRASRRIPQWQTSRSEDDFGVVLIESFAYVADMMSYYIDRVLNEGLIEYAILPESVRNLAALVGYVPNEMAPSSGFVSFTLQPGSPETTIEEGTELLAQTSTGSAPIYFTTTDPLVLGGENPETGTVAVTQGRLVDDEVIGRSAGTAEQAFRLFYANVVPSTVRLKINGVTWLQRSSFAESGPNDRHYVLRTDEQNYTTVRFGDGASGAVPPTNGDVLVSYQYANGAAGNVGVGAISLLTDPIENVITVTNTLPTTGGRWQDTVEDIKREIRLGFTSVDRAVTTEDFAALAINVPGVLFASAVAENYSQVIVYVVPTGGGEPTQDILDATEEFLEERSLIGTDVTAVAPSYIDLNISMTIYVDDSYVQEVVYNDVVDAMADLYALGSHPLGEDAFVAEVWKTVLDVDGVIYMDLDLFARADATQEGATNQTLEPGEVMMLGNLTVSPEGGL